MPESNSNTRLDAFCDGVFAIAITLLIIDVKVPSSDAIVSAADLWQAIGKILPSMFAFLLSFIVILITWVNHHNGAKLVGRSSGPYLYATGFLLLTVVVLPFPTALIGEHLFTDHASPAVILYVSVLALQALAWAATTSAVLSGKLERSTQSVPAIRKNKQYAIAAFGIYIVMGVSAVWFPLTVMLVTCLMWIFWLWHGIGLKAEA